jgi:hypothetical protein
LSEGVDVERVGAGEDGRIGPIGVGTAEKRNFDAVGGTEASLLDGFDHHEILDAAAEPRGG